MGETGTVDKNLLECSVCLTLPDCNIFQCTKSDAHLICQKCHNQLRKPRLCPVCRDRFPPTPRRSHLAEQVTWIECNRSDLCKYTSVLDNFIKITQKQVVASLTQSAPTRGSCKPSAPPSEPTGGPANLQYGLSEVEALERALQESLEVGTLRESFALSIDYDHYDVCIPFQILQITENESAVGPRLHAAIRTHGNSMSPAPHLYASASSTLPMSVAQTAGLWLKIDQGLNIFNVARVKNLEL